MFMDSGLTVDTKQLTTIGPRGVAAAVTGSVLPMCVVFFISKVVLDVSDTAAFAAAISLSATSAGISLNILKGTKVLETTTGQVLPGSGIVLQMCHVVVQMCHTSGVASSGSVPNVYQMCRASGIAGSGSVAHVSRRVAHVLRRVANVSHKWLR
jgi:Kef-type K+ transport system membrane component KefB